MDKDKIEIEIGEFVRTDYGIDKFLYKDKYEEGVDKYVFEMESMSNPEYYVLKHSKNIIDLIEVNDIIVIINENKEKIVICLDSEAFLEKVKRELYSNYWELKSILTKEQFESEKYEVK